MTCSEVTWLFLHWGLDDCYPARRTWRDAGVKCNWCPLTVTVCYYLPKPWRSPEFTKLQGFNKWLNQIRMCLHLPLKQTNEDIGVFLPEHIYTSSGDNQVCHVVAPLQPFISMFLPPPMKWSYVFGLACFWYVFRVFSCLFVCLTVTKITPKLPNGFCWNFKEMLLMTQLKID